MDGKDPQFVVTHTTLKRRKVDIGRLEALPVPGGDGHGEIVAIVGAEIEEGPAPGPGGRRDDTLDDAAAAGEEG